jgi:hypothetical protein
MADTLFSDLLEPWIKVERERGKPTASELELYEGFHGEFCCWLKHNGLKANSMTLAGYLLSLAIEGHSLSTVSAAADGIAFFFAKRRRYLDPAPVDAALALIRAQTRQDRTLN